MMRSRQCPGCGAYFQSEDETEVGYLPAHLGKDEPSGKLICQRCYKIKHYGIDINPKAFIKVEKAIDAGLQWADGLLIILDIVDFDASLPHNLHELLVDKTGLIVINKIDLLPSKTGADEVKRWAQARLKRHGITEEIICVSSITGYGIDKLAVKLTKSSEQNWMVIGVTNAGKSTLIGRVLENLEILPEQAPVSARFPGTTINCVKRMLTDNKVLSDSPGLVPQGRLTDIVCKDCAVKLIGSKKINVTLYNNVRFKSGLAIWGFAAVIPVNLVDETTIIGFTASEFPWQIANVNSIDNRLKLGCHCLREIDWVEYIVEIPPNYDLIVHGLGWVSVRKNKVTCQLIIPYGVRFGLRPNLVGPKNNKTE